MKFIHVASVSSGKDSQAVMLLMIERVGKDNCKFVLCDTGNEDPAVFEHVAYLEYTLGIKIDILKADFTDRIAAKRQFIARDQRIGRRNGKRIRWSNKAKRRALAVLHPTGNPYLDLCLWKGRFPSRKGQFCTAELKTNLLVEYQLELLDQGFSVVSWQGIRRDESASRAKAKLFERSGKGLYQFRPIIHYTAQQTVNVSVSRGLKLNRLYSEGFDRVGCMSCINCGKGEVRNIALRKPLEIDRLRDWENLVGMATKHGASMFFPNPHRDDHLNKFGIDNIVEWSKTTRGGVQRDLLIETVAPACSSSYGLCE